MIVHFHFLSATLSVLYTEGHFLNIRELKHNIMIIADANAPFCAVSLTENKNDCPNNRIIVRGPGDGLKKRLLSFDNGSGLGDFLADLEAKIGNCNKSLPKEKIRRTIEVIPELQSPSINTASVMMVTVKPGDIPPPPPLAGLANFVPPRGAVAMYSKENDGSIHHVQKTKDALVSQTVRIFENTLQKNAGNLMAEVQEKIAFRKIKDLFLNTGVTDNKKIVLADMTEDSIKSHILNNIPQVSDINFYDDDSGETIEPLSFMRSIDVKLKTGDSIKIKFGIDDSDRIMVKKIKSNDMVNVSQYRYGFS